MASTTTNYGWVVPTSSDLVKNGATAISTVGSSVDTSLWNSGFGQAGKNKIINGAFNVWQRGTSFSNPASGAYTADRFWVQYDGTGSTRTVSQQAFAAGTAPVAGYESAYFYRHAQSVAGTGATYNNLINQNIEDVRTFAGQTVTFSFWAKADSARTFTFSGAQNFGSGGSSYVALTSQNVSVTTSWARYSLIVSVPSISGKTVGTSSYLQFSISGALNTVQTLDVWGYSVEYGSVATPFQTASGGSLQGELAMCQRYLPAIFANSASEIGSGYNVSVTQPFLYIPFQVPARVAPTGITATAANYAVRNVGGTPIALTAIAYNNASVVGCALLGTVAAGLIAGQGTTVTLNGTLLFTGCEL